MIETVTDLEGALHDIDPDAKIYVLHPTRVLHYEVTVDTFRTEDRQIVVLTPIGEPMEFDQIMSRT